MFDALVSFGTIPANAAIIVTVLAFDALFTVFNANNTAKAICMPESFFDKLPEMSGAGRMNSGDVRLGPESSSG